MLIASKVRKNFANKYFYSIIVARSLPKSLEKKVFISMTLEGIIFMDCCIEKEALSRFNNVSIFSLHNFILLGSGSTIKLMEDPFLFKHFCKVEHSSTFTLRNLKFFSQNGFQQDYEI